MICIFTTPLIYAGMLKLRQFYSLNIQELDEGDLPQGYHSQNYSELVFIDQGSGIHLLNNTSMPYEAGDLLIVSQEDSHHFEPAAKTRIVAIKFTDSYFKSSHQQQLYADMGFSPERIMNHNGLKETKLSFDADVKTLLRNTIDNILLYSRKKDASSSPIVFYQILSIFGMVRETMNRMHFGSPDLLPAKEKLTAYIHQHIYEPDKIKVATIAARFHISSGYFSAYFKRKFGISFRTYVNQYRLRLIEQRLSTGQVSMKEIAREFGFTDESHFSHFYKNNRGITPSAYPKRS